LNFVQNTRPDPKVPTLIETDSPWLAPVPYRGKPNQPGFVREVGEFIADLKGIGVDELAKVTTDNFYSFFSIPRAS
jgi:TatD DNase family protein